MECNRCGSTGRIEGHHIIYKCHGGKRKRHNKVPLCQGCHDYRHEKEELERQIERELKDNHITEKSRNNRLLVLRKRLEIVEAENTPEKVLQRGYTTYYTQYSEKLPPRVKIKSAISIIQGSLL